MKKYLFSIAVLFVLTGLSYAQGKVVVVAGFQGVSTDSEVTTLGRGGSDTTAVALASEPTRGGAKAVADTLTLRLR